MEKVQCKKHQLVFVKNVYGEKPKSEWKCSVCGKTKYKNYYNKIEG
jgi:transposase-like protein